MRKAVSVLYLLAMISCSLTGNSVLASEDGTSDAASGRTVSDREYIEETLNLANNSDKTWSYDADADAWVMSIVSAVAYPEIPDEQGVSVCVPGAYVIGIDTDGDGEADVTADEISGEASSTANEVPGGANATMDEVSGEADVTADEASGDVTGDLVIDYDAQVTSTNGQVYTAAEAPVILNTGAAGYGSAANTLAATTYAKEGYINVACGNRGKQDTVTDDDGNTTYTGDAPSCLCDQKAAARFVKYNILLGNLPGNTEYFVSTGGSGGGAHAAMFAATSNNPDFYPYQAEVGAVGVYLDEDGNYSTAVTIDGEEVSLSDGAWGCIAYSAITSLAEADMALAFEYYLDTDYDFSSEFQAKLAEYLSQEYMEYINSQNLTVNEAEVGFDLDGDGKTDSTIALSIEYDEEAYADTNGYGGSYLDLYLTEFTSNLQWYLDHLDYAEGWTWFDEDGNALTDEETAAMTTEEKAEAFLEGRYAKADSDTDGPGGMGGAPGDIGSPGGMGGAPGDIGSLGGPDGVPGDIENVPSDLDGAPERPDGNGGPDGELPDMEMTDAELPDAETTEAEITNAEMTDAESPDVETTDAKKMADGKPDEDLQSGDLQSGELQGGEMPNGELPDEEIAPSGSGDTMVVGTPDAGTTQSASGNQDSANYASYEEMLTAYQEDIAELQAGDQYGNSLVELYNPLNYIGAENTEDAAWVRIVMGAAEGDMSMFSSLNLELAWLNAGTSCEIEWQWDGGHVPSEIFSNSFSLYVDQMYAQYAEGQEITVSAAAAQSVNGTATEATGTDLTALVDGTDPTNVSLTLSAAVSYRTEGASKAMPGFDVIDYGQEDYVFGSAEKDARHWDSYLLTVLEEHTEELSALFQGAAE